MLTIIYKLFKLFIIVSLFQTCLFSQENFNESQSSRNLNNVIEKIEKSIINDHRKDNTYEKMLKCYELVYERPDFVYPTISFVRAKFNNYIYDEFKDSSLVIITEDNEGVLSRRYWKETFFNNYIEPIKVIKRCFDFIETNNLVIASYGTTSDGNTDLFVFKKKNKILYPIYIYPNVKTEHLFSSTNLDIIENGIVRIGYNTGDAGETWGPHKFFLINEKQCKLLKVENKSGLETILDGKDYEAQQISKIYYNKDGKVDRKELNYFAQFKDGTFLYKTTKADSLTLYMVDPYKPDRLDKIFETIYLGNKQIQVSGPLRGKVFPVKWKGKNYYISTEEIESK